MPEMAKKGEKKKALADESWLGFKIIDTLSDPWFLLILAHPSRNSHKFVTIVKNNKNKK